VLVSAVGEQGVRQLAREQGWLARLEARRAREERICDAFAAAWAP
jgi:hypothetical protein